MAALLLLVGGVLLISWAVAPAPAAPVAGPARATTPQTQSAAVVRQLDADIDRLRERLSDAPSYPAPSRDPFRYGRPSPTPSPAAAAAAAPVEADAAPALPRLLAILTDRVDGSPVFRAVIAEGGNVRVVTNGDAVGVLRVHRIGADVVELLDRSTSKNFRLVLK